jgi:tripartite-type tricarboxylate transporter receptor subunit TctC
MARFFQLCAAAACTAAMLASSLPAYAQLTEAAAQYPNRAVRVIVPSGPGTPPDVRARQIARKLEVEWQQPVVVENRPGAGGQNALELVARAAPDGYTLCVAGPSPLTITPHLRKQPFDPLKDFAPVAGIGYAPILLLANGALPVSDAQQLLALARKNPGKLNAASWGEATTNHLALELFKRANDVQIAHIPYSDGGRAVTDLLSGQVQIAFDWLHLTRGHVRNGRLKALAVSGDQRLPSYPDIPTFAEAGIAGMDSVGGWMGFVAPARTPDEIARKIHAAVARAFEDPEIRAETQDLGAYTTVRTPEEFAALIRTEHARWREVIAEAGIRVE